VERERWVGRVRGVVEDEHANLWDCKVVSGRPVQLWIMCGVLWMLSENLKCCDKILRNLKCCNRWGLWGGGGSHVKTRGNGVGELVVYV
jgi:hypothetical protein